MRERSMTRAASALLVAIVASAALPACGGEGRPRPEPPNAVGRTATASTATEPAPVDDKVVVRESLLSLSDLPAGWTAADDDDEPEPSDCSAVKEARAAASARDASPDFDHRPTGQVSHSVYAYFDEQKAENAYRNLVASETRRCLGSQLGERVREAADDEDVEIGDVETGELSVDPVGAESNAARISLDYTVSGIDLTLAADLLFIREGRGIAFLVLADETDTFDEQLRARLASISARKLRNALAE